MGGGLVKQGKVSPTRVLDNQQEGTNEIEECSAGRSNHRGRANELRNAALDQLKEALQAPGLPTVARHAMEAAMVALEEARKDASTSERESWRKLPPSAGARAHGGGGLDRDESDKYLLDNFMDNCAEAAEGHHAIESNSPTRAAAAAAAGLEASQRPLTAQVMAQPAVQQLLAAAGHFDFDAASFAELPEVRGRPLRILTAHFARSSGMYSHLHQAGFVPNADDFEAKASEFVGKIDSMYRTDVPYHGPAHAADVLSTMEWFLQMPYVSERTNEVDHFMGLMAAAIHDVGHPGTNNMYQCKTMSPFAIRYNDKSVLEMMHVALAFETMQEQEDCNWFSLLSRDFRRPEDTSGPSASVQQYVRRGLVEMVLSTEMAKHASHVSKLKDVAEEELRLRAAGEADAAIRGDTRESMKQESLEQKLFLLETALHAADISNPCKPRPLMLRWTQRVLSEFWAQGDEEIRLGLPISTLCDRSAGLTSIPKGQIGFISFVVQPFYASFLDLVPEVNLAMDHLMLNKAFWEDCDGENSTYEGIFIAECLSPAALE